MFSEVVIFMLFFHRMVVWMMTYCWKVHQEGKVHLSTIAEKGNPPNLLVGWHTFNVLTKFLSYGRFESCWHPRKSHVLFFEIAKSIHFQKWNHDPCSLGVFPMFRPWHLLKDCAPMAPGVSRKLCPACVKAWGWTVGTVENMCGFPSMGGPQKMDVWKGTNPSTHIFLDDLCKVLKMFWNNSTHVFEILRTYITYMLSYM